MTSRNFGQFFDTPIVTSFITKSLVLPSQNPWLSHDRDVIYGRPLNHINCEYQYQQNLCLYCYIMQYLITFQT